MLEECGAHMRAGERTSGERGGLWRRANKVNATTARSTHPAPRWATHFVQHAETSRPSFSQFVNVQLLADKQTDACWIFLYVVLTVNFDRLTVYLN